MESEDEQEEVGYLTPRPSDLFNKLVFLQADLIYNAMAFLFSPISTLLSLLSELFHRAEETKDTVESAVRKVPSNVAHGLTLLLKKVSYGFLGAAFMCMVLVVLLVAAAAVSAGLMQLWVEEPVDLRERLHFDYTQPHPKAVFGLPGNIGGVAKKKKHLGIPVGHTFWVSVVLLMPESDFNREVGVFQLSAELLSTNGDMITSSSQPCMLRFRSAPIRITRTFLIGVPLLLGISSESQKVTVEILKHKEVSHERSAAIRVCLIPRVGSSALPELYQALIVINSQLPWTKELLRRWKWTCFLWMSMYLYVSFLVTLIFFWRPFFFFPAATLADLGGYNQRAPAKEEADELLEILSKDERTEITVELLRKRQEIRRKRKAAIISHGEVAEEYVGSSASSISFSREYMSAGFEEDVGDSESVCLEGSEDF